MPEKTWSFLDPRYCIRYIMTQSLFHSVLCSRLFYYSQDVFIISWVHFTFVIKNNDTTCTWTFLPLPMYEWCFPKLCFNCAGWMTSKTRLFLPPSFIRYPWLVHRWWLQYFSVIQHKCRCLLDSPDKFRPPAWSLLIIICVNLLCIGKKNLFSKNEAGIYFSGLSMYKNKTTKKKSRPCSRKKINTPALTILNWPRLRVSYSPRVVHWISTNQWMLWTRHIKYAWMDIPRRWLHKSLTQDMKYCDGLPW